MDNKDIVNFSKFFESNFSSKLAEFDKEKFRDLIITEEEEKEQPNKQDDVKTEPQFDPPVDIEQFIVDEDEVDNDIDVEDSLGSYENDTNFTKVKEQKDNYYPVYKDKSEDFSCDVIVEGAKLNDTEARLILESDEWTLMFSGEIDRNGRCKIPIKKLNILEEGLVGRIRLEVIAENTVFVPWEDDFKVKMSKKVSVQFGDQNKKQENLIRESKVKVKVNR